MKKRKKNIGIIWANPFSDNLGVSALAYSAIHLIYNSVKEIEKFNLIIFGSSISGKTEINIAGKNIEVFNIPYQHYYSVKYLIKAFLFPKKAFVKKLFSMDLVFDISEGDSFSDIYGQDRFNRIIGSKTVFNFLRIPQILLPQTIGPFAKKNNEKRAIKEIRKCQVVIARDEMSHKLLKEISNSDNIADESIDLAFALPFDKKSFNDKKIHVGINVSGLLCSGGYEQNNQFNLKCNYHELIEEIIKNFYEMDNVQIHLIPHVVPINYPLEDDYKISLEIKEKYPQLILPNRFADPISAKSYISRMDFFTGARMHSCIAAFSSGVPVVPMAYSRKFNGLFDKTLNYPYTADCVNESQEIVFKKIKSGFNSRTQLKKLISTSLKNIVVPRLNIINQVLKSNIQKQ
tara:strand:- start:10841 stop:12049 length:1209 start_codon:yes stop_codon:yes gene_type:complete